MIVIYRGNDVLHSDSARGFANAISPIITEEKNKVPSLSLQIVVGNPCYESIKNGDIITVEEDGEIIFRGRVDKITLDFRNNKKLDCVGEFTFFNDSVIRPFNAFSGTVRDILNLLIREHNTCADSDKQYVVGNVENGNTYSFVNENYCSIMAYMQESVLGAIGGQIYFDSDENGIRRINYRLFPTTSTQNIEYGSNLLDMQNAVNDSEIFTVLVPIGKDNLTITSVAGRDYVENTEAVAIYGRRWKVETFDTSDANELLNLANERVNAASIIIPTVTLKAFDLYNMGPDWGAQKFEIGQNVNVSSEAHGINLTFEVQKITRNLLNPTSSSIQVGQIEKGMTSRVQSTEKRIEEKAEKGGGISYPVQRTDLAEDVQNSLNVFDSLGLSVINGRVYDSWEE